MIWCQERESPCVRSTTCSACTSTETASAADLPKRKTEPKHRSRLHRPIRKVRPDLAPAGRSRRSETRKGLIRQRRETGNQTADPPAARLPHNQPRTRRQPPHFASVAVGGIPGLQSRFPLLLCQLLAAFRPVARGSGRGHASAAPSR